MEKKILNEELFRMKYLFGHKRGVIISEQSNNNNFKYDSKLPIRKNVESAGGDWATVKKQFNSSGSASDNMNIVKAMKDGWLPSQPVPDKYIIKNASGTTPAAGTTAATETTAATGTAPKDYQTATSISIKGVYEQLAKGQEKMNNQIFQTFAYKIIVAPGPNTLSGTDGGGESVQANVGKIDGVASKLATDEFQKKYTEFASYTYVQTPQGGFGPNTNIESIIKPAAAPTTKEPATKTPTKNDPEVDAELQNENTIEQWCETNKVLVDEGCYPVQGMEFAEARKKSYNDAKKQNRIYKRGEEYWDENTKIYIAIYGSKSRTRRDLKKRIKLLQQGQDEEVPNNVNSNQIANTGSLPQGRDSKSGLLYDDI
jgi:hypothetical protein